MTAERAVWAERERSVDPGQAPAGLAAMLGAWVARLDGLSRVVLERRIVRIDGTLADIGQEYGLSRERVRQVQKKLAGELSAWLRTPSASARVAELRARVEAARPVLQRWAELTGGVPELGDRIPGTGVCLADLAAFLVPELCRDGDWAGCRPVARMRERTVEAATRSLPVGHRVARLAALQCDLAMNDEHWDAWLGYCGLRRFRGAAVRLKATVPELAEAVLAGAGRPMTSAEIAAEIGAPTWKVRDACLGRDGRFRRTRPGTYGLAEWPMPAYRGIRELIAAEIIAAGGRARLDDIAARLAERYGVSPASVDRYARGPEFTLVGGMVAISHKGAGHACRSPGRARGRYRHKVVSAAFTGAATATIAGFTVGAAFASNPAYHLGAPGKPNRSRFTAASSRPCITHVAPFGTKLAVSGSGRVARSAGHTGAKQVQAGRMYEANVGTRTTSRSLTGTEVSARIAVGCAQSAALLLSYHGRSNGARHGWAGSPVLRGPSTRSKPT